MSIGIWKKNIKEIVYPSSDRLLMRPPLPRGRQLGALWASSPPKLSHPDGAAGFLLCVQFLL